MSNSCEVSNVDSNSINTRVVIYIIVGIILFVVGFYLYKFHYGLSNANGDWGTFGDYVGGILNPVIAAFAFYLIAKTYELQKKELEETRKLLVISTAAQNAQVKLAALSALHNLNVTRIGRLELEKRSLLERESQYMRPIDNPNEIMREALSVNYGKPKIYSQEKMDTINSEIKRLKNKNFEIEMKIETFDL